MKHLDDNFESIITDMPDVMNEEQFQDLLNLKGIATKPYYNRAKRLLLKGLLTSAKDSRAISKNKILLGGACNFGGKSSESRIFLVAKDKVVLIWKGDNTDYCDMWQNTRDRMLKANI